MKEKKLKLGIIGCGNMGMAILSAVHQTYDVCVAEKDQKRCSMARRRYKVTTGDVPHLMKNAKVVLLAVKPQDFEKTLTEIRPHLESDQIVVSIAAGITCAFIEKRLGKSVRVVRCMPNLPAQIGEGMTALCRGKNAKPNDLKLACQLLGCVGETISVDEKWLNAVTAVSGSGPAYVFMFIECFMKSAQGLGFNSALSQKLVTSTIKGSLSLYEKSKEPAHALRQRVTSKGGTTEAALNVFFKHNIEKIFSEALTAAQQRAKELSA